ncbi:MAG: hypothetical protein RDU01_04205 [Thermodesulfovibrionales bacterium]|nr:hypothetical protein [Thermodesulfovibrionales bacterium]
MHGNICRVVVIILFISSLSSISWAHELKSRFTTIVYNSEDLVRKFNKELSLGRLSYLLKNRPGITVEDEVGNKVDVIIERVETILEMFPRDVKFTIILLPSEDEVQAVYKNKYGRSVDYIAFYAPKDRILYISVRDVDIGVLAHEIAHVIIDFYYGISTPTKIHEVLAQYVETHLKD